MFKVGQKVICIIKFNGCGYLTREPVPFHWIMPVVDNEYTIRGVKDDGFLLLEELQYTNKFGEDVGFDPSKFAPLKSISQLDTAAIAKELTLLNPAEIKTPMPVQKPVNQPSPV